jgi:hypothetical protein
MAEQRDRPQSSVVELSDGDVSRRGHALVLVGYAALTVLVLWPAVRHFTTRPMIGSGDSSIFYWAWWWMPRELAAVGNPFHTTDLMYPVGVDLGVTVTAPGVSLLSWPVRAALGPEAQVNAVQLVAAFTAAAAAYFLSFRIWRHRGAAAIAGAAFAFAPYRFVQLGEHLNLVATGVIPLSILLFLRFADTPSWRRALAVGGSLGFAALVDPQLAAISAVGILPFAVIHRTVVRQRAWSLAAGTVLALLVAAPVLVPLVLGLVNGESSTPPQPHEMAAASASPFSWIVPPYSHPLFGALAEVGPFKIRTEGIVYPGLILLGLVLAGRDMGQRQRKGWVALAWIGFVLSLGPYLVIGYEYLRLPLPYFALRALPFMDTMRVPGRFALLGVLAVGVLAAGALAELARRHPTRSAAILFGVAGVLALELLRGGVAQRDGGAPPAYDAIAADPGDGAVLEIPMQWSTGVEVVGDTSNDLHVALFMAWATVHGKPYVGGSVSRYPDERLERLYDIDVYRQLLAIEEEPGFHDPSTFDAEDLAELGIGYVVYHRDAPEPGALAYLRTLDLPVLADDGTVLVWKVP